MTNGIVKTYKKYKNYGFITAENGDDLFVHSSQVYPNIKKGDKVTFEIEKGPKGDSAINVVLIENGTDLSVSNQIIFSDSEKKEVIKSIAKYWKLEAKLEKQNKYFFNSTNVDSIIDGEKYYIIGRKGSGKSSISEFILGLNDYENFSEKLSFKNFPFNELYGLDNTQYTPPNQYITLWKYLIYSTIAKLMIVNEAIDGNIRSKLEEIYSTNPIKSLSRTISQWTSTEFGASFMGTGGTFKLGRDVKTNSGSWIDLVSALEDIISNHCDSSKYFIIFDELDEDYRSIKEKDHIHYNYLLTSLFKAVQDIRYTFSDTNLNIRPIVFLRDDIYSLIKDADKNKWRDFKIEIEWSEKEIKDLLAYRISRDANLEESLSFNQAWNLIFESSSVRAGSGKMTNSFDFITRSTHLRPRDYIRYIQVCAEETASFERSQIESETIRFVDRAFSNYLRDEIVDEVYPLVTEIEEVLQIISNIRKWNFSISEFRKQWNNYYANSSEAIHNFDKVLEVLYRFSVLGNQHPRKKEILYFKYMHTNMNLNKNERLVLHRGLFKALQIV